MQGLPAAGPDDATQDDEDEPWGSWAGSLQLWQFLAQPREVRQLQELQNESEEHLGQFHPQKKSLSQLQAEQMTALLAGMEYGRVAGREEER